MATSLKWQLIAALSAPLVVSACGDDDKQESVSDAGTRGDGGKMTETPGETSTAALGPQVSGKPCTNASECTGKGGSCLSQLSVAGSLGQALEAALGQSLSFTASGGYCSASCMQNSACGEGGVCFGALPGLFAGECRKSCSADSDCREGYECAKQGSTGGDGGVGLTLLPPTCTPKLQFPTVPANTIGKSCTPENAATTCGGGDCLAGTCANGCTNDAQCGAGAYCQLVNLYGTLGTCVETCSRDEDCEQYASGADVGCVAAQGRNVCGTKQRPLAPGVVGNACTAANEATQCGATGECATSLGLPPTPAPDGYCSLLGCSDNTQCGGGACVGAVAALARCYKSCSSNGDCRTGYTCQDRSARGGTTAKVCAPTPAGDAGAPLPTLDGGV